MLHKLGIFVVFHPQILSVTKREYVYYASWKLMTTTTTTTTTTNYIREFQRKFPIFRIFSHESLKTKETIAYYRIFNKINRYLLKKLLSYSLRYFT